MGFSISWLAIATDDSAAVLGKLGMSDTGQADRSSESPFSLASLPTGWTVVFANRYDFVSSRRLTRLSSGTDLVAVQVEEHVMASGAFGYSNGGCVWSVEHANERGIYDLNVSGTPPAQFADIRRRLTARQLGQTGVDYIFDIPVELAASLVSYRHDTWKFDWGEPQFTRIVASVPRDPGWVTRLFWRK